MGPQEIWTRCLRGIEEEVGAENVETWLKPLEIKGINGGEITFFVPDKFFGERVKEKYSDLLSEHFKRIIGREKVRVLFVDDRGTLPPSPLLFLGVSPLPQRGKLNPHYTFEHFIVGSCNEFAYAAARRVVDNPGRIYNPLVIYGGVGLGKTHLLNAVGHSLLLKKRDANIVYTSSEEFTNEFISSVRYKTTAEFRNKYRGMDALLIDDIEFIAGKQQTQEEFFHTFNALHNAGRQIVITSDLAIREMPEMDERLRSRFQMGLTADLQPPPLEMRVAFLKARAERDGVPLTDEVALFLGEHLKTHFRELEGCLAKLALVSSLRNTHNTIELAKEVLRDVLLEKNRIISIEEIQEAVAQEFKVKVIDLKSKRRTKSLTSPRQIAMYLSRTLAKQSFPEIGKAFGGKDHSTVIYACNQIERRREGDQVLRQALDRLTRYLEEEGVR